MDDSNEAMGANRGRGKGCGPCYHVLLLSQQDKGCEVGAFLHSWSFFLFFFHPIPSANSTLPPSPNSSLKNHSLLDMDTVQAHQDYLNGDQIYSCSDCHAHLGRNVDIISKVCRSIFYHQKGWLF